MEKFLLLQIKTVEKNGNSYKSAYLIVDLDYTRKTLTWNKQDIAEILGIAVFDLVMLPDGIYRLGCIDDGLIKNKLGGMKGENIKK